MHTGWELLSNPLYGNFKPNQQPYRTLVLRKGQSSAADMESLSLIESAMGIYRNAPVVRLPEDMPEDTGGDFRYLDFKLMEETFRTYGLLSSVFGRTAGRCEPAGQN